MMCLDISNIIVIAVKFADYRCIIHYISKSDATELLEILCLMIVHIYDMHIKRINLKNRFYNYCFDNLIKGRKLETKNILIDKENYKDLVTTILPDMFTRSR